MSSTAVIQNSRPLDKTWLENAPEQLRGFLELPVFLEVIEYEHKNRFMEMDRDEIEFLYEFFTPHLTDIIDANHPMYAYYKMVLYFIVREFDDQGVIKALSVIKANSPKFLQDFLHHDLHDILFEFWDFRKNNLLVACVELRMFKAAAFIVEECEMNDPFDKGMDHWFNPVSSIVNRFKDLEQYFYEVKHDEFDAEVDKCISFLRLFLSYHPIDIYEFEGAEPNIPFVFRLMLTGNVPLVKFFHELYDIDFLRPFEVYVHDANGIDRLQVLTPFEFAMIRKGGNADLLRYMDNQVHATGSEFRLESLLTRSLDYQNCYVFRNLAMHFPVCLMTKLIEDPNGRIQVADKKYKKVFRVWDFCMKISPAALKPSFLRQVIQSYHKEFVKLLPMTPSEYICTNMIESPLIECARKDNQILLRSLIVLDWFPFHDPELNEALHAKGSSLDELIQAVFANMSRTRMELVNYRKRLALLEEELDEVKQLLKKPKTL